VKIWWAMIVLLTGCAAQPFAREPLPILQNPDAQAMRQSFAASIPAKFVSDDTIVVSVPFHSDMAFLTVMRADRTAGKFEIAALNLTGIKLFDITSDSSGAIVQYAVPPLEKHKDILLMVAAAIREMFLDLTPPAESKTNARKTKVQYVNGNMVYQIGGNPAVLLEKKEDGLLGFKWRVQYFRYASDSGRLYPRGLVMDNGTYHYRIVWKNRDMVIDQ
jgi:hypothetical protein